MSELEHSILPSKSTSEPLTSGTERIHKETHHPFQELLTALREEGIRVSTSEWLDLQQVLAENTIHSLDQLYLVARTVLIKDVTNYPLYDLAFGRLFYDMDLAEHSDEDDSGEEYEGEESLPEEEEVIQQDPEGIDEVVEAVTFTSEEVHGGNEATKDIQNSPNAANDGMQSENHGAEDGASPDSQQGAGEGGGEQRDAQGGGAENEGGEGGGESKLEGKGGEGSKNEDGGGGKKLEESATESKLGKGGFSSAREIIEERRFKSFDEQKVIEYGQIGRALARLTTIVEDNTFVQTENLDIDATINGVARTGGVRELIWREEVEDRPKVILLFDVGGSTDEFRPIMEKLFAAAKDYLRELEVYYFHNAIYGDVWLPRDGEWGEHYIPLDKILAKDSESKVIIVGDAWMADYELYNFVGDNSGKSTNLAGVDYFQQIADRFPSTVWINPILEKDHEEWDNSGTIGEIKSIFPMYDLSLNGIEDAVKKLIEE